MVNRQDIACPPGIPDNGEQVRRYQEHTAEKKKLKREAARFRIIYSLSVGSQTPVGEISSARRVPDSIVRLVPLL